MHIGKVAIAAKEPSKEKTARSDSHEWSLSGWIKRLVQSAY